MRVDRYVRISVSCLDSLIFFYAGKSKVKKKKVNAQKYRKIKKRKNTLEINIVFKPVFWNKISDVQYKNEKKFPVIFWVISIVFIISKKKNIDVWIKYF